MEHPKIIWQKLPFYCHIQYSCKPLYTDFNKHNPNNMAKNDKYMSQYLAEI